MSTRAAGGGCRSTTRRTSATRWPASARSPSRTSRPGARPQAAAERGQEVQDRAGRVHRRPAADRSASSVGPRDDPVQLPSGFVTMLMTDIEGSTALVHRLGDGYARADRRSAGASSGLRRGRPAATRSRRGPTSSSRCSRLPAAALDAAVAIQRQLRGRRVAGGSRGARPDRDPQRLPDAHRRELHRHGRPHRGAICEAAQGSQILVTGDTREATRGFSPMACASRASVGIACAVSRTRWRCSRSQHRVSSPVPSHATSLSR